MSEIDGICTACMSANPPDVRMDRSDNNHQQEILPSLSSQEHNAAELSASSEPFVPSNSQSHQQEVGEKSPPISSAPFVSVAFEATPKILPQQEADKITLSVSSPPFDPSWREKLGTSPALALPDSTTASTSMSATQQASFSVIGNNAATMMPGVYHHPMNMMPSSMSMSEHRMPMTDIPGQVNQPYLKSRIPPANTHVLIYLTNTPSNLPSNRWNTSTP